MVYEDLDNMDSEMSESRFRSRISQERMTEGWKREGKLYAEKDCKDRSYQDESWWREEEKKRRERKRVKGHGRQERCAGYE